MSAPRAPRPRRLGPLGRLVDSIKFRVVLAASLLFTLIAMAAALILIQSWSRDLESRRPPEVAEAVDRLCAELVGQRRFSELAVSSLRPISYKVVSPSGERSEGYLLQAPPTGATGAAGAAVRASVSCTQPGLWRLSRQGDPPDGLVQTTLTRPVDLGDGRWQVVATTTSTAAPDDVLTMVQAARLVIPALVLVVAVLLWIVTAEALRPVESLIRASKEVSLGTLDQRIPTPRHADEIAELTVQLNSMFDRLEAANARQQQFVSDASHELRSPVATILALSERPGPTTDVSLIHSEASRLSGLIDSLLELARVQEGAPVRRERLGLHELLLEDAERVLVPAERRGITVDTSSVRKVWVPANRSALTGVVRNLVDNALRHATSEVALACRWDADEAVIEVHDDGPGIPEDMRAEVFGRFVRLDTGRSRDVGGTGLGLALVRDLVTAHGGSVTAHASPLGGALFEVRLPRHPDDAPGHDDA